MRGFGDHGFSFGDDPFGVRAAFRASPWGAWTVGGPGVDPASGWSNAWGFDPSAGFQSGARTQAADFGFTPLATPAMGVMMMSAFAVGVLAGFAAAGAMSAMMRGPNG